MFFFVTTCYFDPVTYYDDLVTDRYFDLLICILILSQISNVVNLPFQITKATSLKTLLIKESEVKLFNEVNFISLRISELFSWDFVNLFRLLSNLILQ